MALFDDKNPKCSVGFTPLHLAAEHGHLDLCIFIRQQIVDRNPRNNTGWTPLHSAALNGHGAVCKLIADDLIEKNPRTNDGITPKELMKSFARQDNLASCKTHFPAAL